MNANVEIKARVADPEAFAAVAASLADGPPERLTQEDVFFPSPTGRLKLRSFAEGGGELIAYMRPDVEGPKTSRYSIAPVADPAAVRRTLGAALGELGVVRKVRAVFKAGRTRIHLDGVENLGWFMELEVVLDPDEDPVLGEAEAADLMRRLNVGEDDLVDRAYIDLLMEGA